MSNDTSSIVEYVKPGMDEPLGDSITISSESNKTSVQEIKDPSFVADYLNPIKDKIGDIPLFEKLLQKVIKVSDKAGPLGDLTTISCENTEITFSYDMQSSKRFKFSAENIGKWLLDGDTTIGVLSRLPIEFVLDMKTVCKWWYHLTTCHDFRKLHFKNSQNTRCGIFLHGFLSCSCCDYFLDNRYGGYIGFGTTKELMTKNNPLDFLPEKVIVTASCNGLLVCRSLFRREIGHYSKLDDPVDGRFLSADAEFFIYVCNPFTKEFNVLKPNFTNRVRCGVGFAFDSFSICFEVVVVEALRKTKSSFCYMFKIYSSKTETWRVSKDICNYPYRLFFEQHVFVNGVFYWLTDGHSILTFDVKKETSEVINLPGPAAHRPGFKGMCLSESEGHLCYVFLSRFKLRAWILNRDHSKPDWVLKYFWNISHGFELVHPRYWKKDSISSEPIWNHVPNCAICPLALVDDILYVIQNEAKFYGACNLKTGHIQILGSSEGWNHHCICRPVGWLYSKSLLPVFSNPKSFFS